VGLHPAGPGAQAPALRAERQPQHPARRLSLGARHLEGRFRLQQRRPAEAVDEFHTIAVVASARAAGTTPPSTSPTPRRIRSTSDLASPGQQLRAGHGRELERHHAKPPSDRPGVDPGQLRTHHRHGGRLAGEGERALGGGHSPADSTRTTSAAAPSTSSTPGTARCSTSSAATTRRAPAIPATTSARCWRPCR